MRSTERFFALAERTPEPAIGAARLVQIRAGAFVSCMAAEVQVAADFLHHDHCDRVRSAYGAEAHCPLVALRQRYDPDGVFLSSRPGPAPAEVHAGGFSGE